MAVFKNAFVSITQTGFWRGSVILQYYELRNFYAGSMPFFRRGYYLRQSYKTLTGKDAFVSTRVSYTVKVIKVGRTKCLISLESVVRSERRRYTFPSKPNE